MNHHQNRGLTGGIYIGMDAGGTKTKVSLTRHDLAPLQSFEGPGLNLNSLGEAGFADHLSALKSELKQTLIKLGLSASSILGIGLGIAGISNPLTKELAEESLKELGCPISVMGDHEAALLGALGGEDGLLLISGTGSICLGRVNGRLYRAGGYGHLFDDLGSGYAIGRDILQGCVMGEDGRSEKTLLWPMVQAHLKIDSLSELVQTVYHPDFGKKEMAALARLLPGACEKGDPTALSIARRASEDLLSLIRAVLSKIRAENGGGAFFDSVYAAGGILQNCTPVKEALAVRLHEEGFGRGLAAPKFDASIGAIYPFIAEESHAFDN